MPVHTLEENMHEHIDTPFLGAALQLLQLWEFSGKFREQKQKPDSFSKL